MNKDLAVISIKPIEIKDNRFLFQLLSERKLNENISHKKMPSYLQHVKFVIGSEIDVLGRLIKGVKKVNADILFRVTSENPYIYWEGIDKLIQNHFLENHDLTFYKNLPIGASYEIINLKSLEIAHKLGNAKHRSEYSTLYFFENQDKFLINPVLPKKSLQFPKIRLTVDTPEDLIVARIIHGKLGRKSNPIKLEKIINLLNSNKKILKLNTKIELKYTRYL